MPGPQTEGGVERKWIGLEFSLDANFRVADKPLASRGRNRFHGKTVPSFFEARRAIAISYGCNVTVDRDRVERR